MQDQQSNNPRQQDQQQTTQTGQSGNSSSEPHLQPIPKQVDKAEGEDMDYGNGGQERSSTDGNAA